MADQPTLAELLFQDGGQALRNGFVNGARNFGDQASSAINGQQPPAAYTGGATPNQYVDQNWGAMADQGRQVSPDMIMKLIQSARIR